MNLGGAIKSIRKRRRIKQRDLSEQVGITVTSLSLIETNRTSPQKKTLDRIAEVLGVPLSYIYLSTLTEVDFPEDKRESCLILLAHIKLLLNENIERT